MTTANLLCGHVLGWNLAHVVKVGQEEPAFLGGDEPEGARRLWHDGLRLLVVTRGRAGCAYATPALAGDVPGFSVRAVDTTGAGDGFVAGRLKGLLETPQAWGMRRACGRFCATPTRWGRRRRPAVAILDTRRNSWYNFCNRIG